jgi:hypothetical protein
MDLGEPADEALEDLLAGSSQLVTLADDRWASLPALLAGRVFTHRVTGQEVEHDVLTVDPDLDPIAVSAELARLPEPSPADRDGAQDGAQGSVATLRDALRYLAEPAVAEAVVMEP